MRANIVNIVSKCCTPDKRDSLESVIAYCRENERVCSSPQYRNALWEILPIVPKLTASGNRQHPVVSGLILRASKPVSISSSEFPRAVGEQQKLDRYYPK